jgi:hypothetical protein
MMDTTIFVLVFNSAAGVGGYFLLGRLYLTSTLLLGSRVIINIVLGPKLL